VNVFLILSYDKDLFSINLHIFGYSVSLLWNLSGGITYCILFFIVAYFVCDLCMIMYVGKYYSIVDLHVIYMLY
jgi:hypothetical protein